MKSVEIPVGHHTWPLTVPSEIPVFRKVEVPVPPWNAEACVQRALETLPHIPKHPLVVVPDRTRNAHLPFWLPHIWNALQKLGADIQELRCLFAAGTHAPMSAHEMNAAVGPTRFPVKLRSHDVASPLLRAGLGPDGDPIYVSPELLSSDGVLVLSVMNFHYLAGFGGGRKMIIPGCCDRDTARRLHARCLQDTPLGRAEQVCAGSLDLNPLHQWILAALAQLELPPLCGISMVSDATGPLDAEGGTLFDHHRTLAQRFSQARTVHHDTQLDGILLSCGGHPYDTDLVQAHKALDAISSLLRTGARVAWLAALPRGLGHDEMLGWLRDGNAQTQLERLAKNFHIGKQTAWSIRRHLENFDVALVGQPTLELSRELGVQSLANASAAWDFVQGAGPHIAIAPMGAALRYALRP